MLLRTFLGLGPYFLSSVGKKHNPQFWMLRFTASDLGPKAFISDLALCCGSDVCAERGRGQDARGWGKERSSV